LFFSLNLHVHSVTHNFPLCCVNFLWVYYTIIFEFVNPYRDFFSDFSEFFGGHSRQIFFLPDPDTA